MSRPCLRAPGYRRHFHCSGALSGPCTALGWEVGAVLPCRRNDDHATRGRLRCIQARLEGLTLSVRQELVVYKKPVSNDMRAGLGAAAMAVHVAGKADLSLLCCLRLSRAQLFHTE